MLPSGAGRIDLIPARRVSFAGWPSAPVAVVLCEPATRSTRPPGVMRAMK